VLLQEEFRAEEICQERKRRLRWNDEAQISERESGKQAVETCGHTEEGAIEGCAAEYRTSNCQDSRLPAQYIYVTDSAHRLCHQQIATAIEDHEYHDERERGRL